MAAPSVTHTFSNGTTAEASEVNTNFNDIINGITDGTSDLTIGALTAQGTVTLNGAVNLGNATGDTITITGYTSGDIIPSSNGADGLGNGTLNFNALYLDNTTTDGGAVYFDAGSTEFLKATADGTELDVGGFARLDIPAGYYKETTSAKSADYTVTDTDGIKVVLMTTSSTDRVVTLPTASANTGRSIKVVKVDSGTGKCTIKGEAAGEKVGGISGTTGFDLVLQFDYAEVVCDGTEWHVTSYREHSAWADYTPGTNGLGTISSVNMEWRKAGDSIELRGDFVVGTATAAEAQVDLPNSWTVVSTSSGTIVCGIIERNGNRTMRRQALLATNGDAFLNIGRYLDGSAAQIDVALDGDVLYASGDRAIVHTVSIPITQLANAVPHA